MKKLLLILASLLLIGASSVHAQTDTTKKKMQTKVDKYSEMTKVTSADVPQAVRTTLQDSKYIGWENAPIYKSKAGDIYMLEIKKGVQVKTYKFDANGKPISD